MQPLMSEPWLAQHLSTIVSVLTYMSLTIKKHRPCASNTYQISYRVVATGCTPCNPESSIPAGAVPMIDRHEIPVRPEFFCKRPTATDEAGWSPFVSLNFDIRYCIDNRNHELDSQCTSANPITAMSM